MTRPSSSYMYLLVACILFATYVRWSTFDAGDPHKCQAALRTGQWLDPPSSSRGTGPFQKWQPDGCTLREYKAPAITACLHAEQGRGAVFIGDSTVREVFWALARRLNERAAVEQSAAVVQKHADIQFSHEGATLNFVWDPFLNSSVLPRFLSASRGHSEDKEHAGSTMNKALVVVGGGLWFSKDSPHTVEQFKLALDSAALAAEPAPTQDHLLQHHMLSGANRIFFLPVQAPYYEHLDEAHKEMLHPHEIDDMNAYLADVPAIHQVNVLTSALEMTDNAPEAYQENGLHVIRSIADRQAEVLLNLRCNNLYQEYPYDGTCCYNYPRTHFQTFALGLGAIALVAAVWVELKVWAGAGHSAAVDGMKRRVPALRPVIVMWAALCFCFLADRTQLFNKVAKQYDNDDFFLLCAVIVLAGALTVRKSGTPERSNQEKPTEQDQPVLSRDQTDEWKGWMQALILAYHYTGASKVLWIYRIVRLLVAGYLFMTGYGHAAYFYQKSDFSLKRVVAVNIRVNLLSILLPWIMETDYLFYYFAPLVTYWYIIIYATMRIQSSWNHNLPFFLLKIVLAAASTTFLHTQPFLFEPFFAVVNTVFGSRWEVREWLFRVSLDQYIVYIGMVVSVLYIRSTKPPPPPPPPQEPFATTSHVRPGLSPNLKSTLMFISSFIALVVYGYAAGTRTTKSSSNQLHTYISPLAILSFVHLRNCTRGLRNYYSAAYAWLGRISLETFILQYHIWLAADTRGLLSTGLFGGGGMGRGTGFMGGGMGFARWADCLLLGAVFVWVSYRVAGATAGITAAAVKALF